MTTNPRILIIALSGIGDALMFTPALQLIHKNLPASKIDAIVMYEGVKEIYERTGFFNEVHYFNFLQEGALKSFRYIVSFRSRYDVSINVYPSNRREYNIIQFLIGAKKRAAVRYLRQNFKNFGFLNTNTIIEDDHFHNVQENLRLAQHVLGLEDNENYPLLYPLLPQDIQIAGNFISLLSPDKQIIGIHPGCSTLKNHIKRRWEPEKFSALIRLIIDQLNVRVLLFGGPEEKELRNRILSEVNSEFCMEVPSKNLSESAAVIKHCALFITNDSSLMHVASAMQRKVIALIGPTNINYIHPWATEYEIASLNLDCAPCFFYSPKPLECSREDVKFKCIKELTVGNVFKLVEENLITE